MITKNVVFVVHSAKDRYLNVREHMALMGLPHDYKVDDTVIKSWLDLLWPELSIVLGDVTQLFTGVSILDSKGRNLPIENSNLSYQHL